MWASHHGGQTISISICLILVYHFLSFLHVGYDMSGHLQWNLPKSLLKLISPLIDWSFNHQNPLGGLDALSQYNDLNQRNLTVGVVFPLVIWPKQQCQSSNEVSSSLFSYVCYLFGEELTLLTSLRQSK
jgi:hypothetical protein